MVDNSTQPTILVKRADGTTERITLAELKNRQTKMAAVVASSNVPSTLPNVQIVNPPAVLPIKTAALPMKKNSPSIPTAANLKPADVKPLLEEQVPDSPHASTTTVSARVDQVSKIIASLSFTVPAQYANRLRSSIQLRLKDIRSEVDTLDLCLRSIKDGGLGLTETQAQEIVTKSKPIALKIDKKLTPASDIEMAAPIAIPKRMEKEAVIEKIIGQAAPVAEISDLIPKKNVTSNSTAPLRPIVAQTSSKPLMHDVKTKPVSLSPLDEIQYFSLVDLRRLSSKPVEAVARLKQKFINLRDESFVLFMDSWNAWRNSPLYQNYIQATDEALTRKVSLQTVLGSKEKISLLEMEELIKMEKELEI
jgi:hypothetical protein